MKRIVLGITGATGVTLGVRLLEHLVSQAEVHLVLSESAAKVIKQETIYPLSYIEQLAQHHYSNNAIDAPIASGSYLTDGMIITPCTIKTLSAIAHSYSDTLIARAADVTLKQRRTLILGIRETPLHLGHLRLMSLAAENGACIMPFMPAFYSRPGSIDDLLDHWVAQALDLLHIDHTISPRYAGPDVEQREMQEELVLDPA